jgi:hypothetical protein
VSKGRKKPGHQLHPSEREYAREHFPPLEESREDWHARVRAGLAREEEWRRKWRRKGYRYPPPIPSYQERWERARKRSPAELTQAEAQRKFREELDEHVRGEGFSEPELDLPRGRSRKEREHRLYQRPGERARETRAVNDELGSSSGYVVSDGSWRDPGRPRLDFERTISKALGDAGVSAEEARLAFASGPPTAEREALREKLQPVLRELVEQGVVRRGGRKRVPKAAVARFFACSPKSIQRFLG